MYRRIIILVVIFLVCVSGQLSNNYIPKYTAKEILYKIDHYYKSNSKDSLRLFLDEWQKMIPPVSEENVNHNDTISNIYKVFIDLYKPSKFGNVETVSPFINKNGFIVIQNNINYEVVSIKRFNNLKKSGYASLSGKDFTSKQLIRFRPKLNIGHIKYLYLTSEYEKGISDFLGNIENSAMSEKEIMNRLAFIKTELPIVQSHDGGNWYIETFPIINKITFDSNFKHAFVKFRISMGNTVFAYPLTKTLGHWQPDKYKVLPMITE